MATYAQSSETGNSSIDALISGSQWSSDGITYSFPNSVADYEKGYSELANGFAQVSFAQQQAVRYILEGQSSESGGPKMTLAWVEGFTNAQLTYGGFSGNADIRIAQSPSANPTAYGYLPSSHSEGGDIWFGRAYNYRTPEIGSYEFVTILHELGHALGLSHPDGMPSSRDALEYTVMSYNSYVGQASSAYSNEYYGFPQTYMMYDIAALQHMYGADFSFRSSDTIYKWMPTTGESFVNGVGQGAPGSGSNIFATIWDGGGTDTYDFTSYSNAVSVTLAPGAASIASSAQQAYLGDGHYARGNIYNALLYEGDARSLIERAYGGSGSDTIRGNTAANTLDGNRGNDELYGRSGNDRLYGDAGSDSLYGEDGDDRLYGGSGDDIFVFNTAPQTTENYDVISDYSIVDDTFYLENSVFRALTKTGTLSSGAFYVGASAHDATDRIFYDKSSGNLWYDLDGTGAAAPVRFADITAGLGMTAAEFYII